MEVVQKDRCKHIAERILQNLRDQGINIVTTSEGLTNFIHQEVNKTEEQFIADAKKKISTVELEALKKVYQ